MTARVTGLATAEQAGGIQTADVLAVVVALLTFVFFVHPINDANWSESDFDVIAAVSVAVLAALLQAVIAESLTPWAVKRYGKNGGQAVRDLALPFLMAVVAVIVWPAHQTQASMLDAFDAYTHRFPEGRFHDYYLQNREGRQGVVCAYEGDEHRMQNGNEIWDPTSFCLIIDLDRPTGDQTTGGFRKTEFDAVATECFGRGAELCDPGG